MPEVLAPAVFVTEVAFAAHPIEGVATSASDPLAADHVDRLIGPLPNGPTPEWTAHNGHDPGRTLLELSPWVAESLAFRCDGLPLHAAATAALQADHQDHAAQDGSSSEVTPNREFPDLWLRFVSSAAQPEHRRAPDHEVGRVDTSQVAGRYIGETEKNLDAVLSRANLSGAALQFDEAAALFGQRTEVRDSHDRYANQEAKHALQRIECRDGATSVTTNAEIGSSDISGRKHAGRESSLSHISGRGLG